MTKSLFSVLIMVFLLTSCQSWAEYVRQAQERQRQQDVQRCVDFGYQPGSPGHADCMMELYRERKEDERRRQEVYDQERLIRASREQECTVRRSRNKDKHSSEITEQVRCE